MSINVRGRCLISENHEHFIPSKYTLYGVATNYMHAALDNCANAACLNNGTCQDLVEGFVCVCTPLFEGPACSRPGKILTDT